MNISISSHTSDIYLICSSERATCLATNRANDVELQVNDVVKLHVNNVVQTVRETSVGIG